MWKHFSINQTNDLGKVLKIKLNFNSPEEERRDIGWVNKRKREERQAIFTVCAHPPEYIHRIYTNQSGITHTAVVFSCWANANTKHIQAIKNKDRNILRRGGLE